MSHNSAPPAEAALARTRPLAGWRLARLLLAGLALAGVLACTEQKTSSGVGPLQASFVPVDPPTTLSDLEGNASIQHPPDMTPTFVWSWERDSVVDPTNTTRIVASSDTAKNETWKVTVFADFGSSTSEPDTNEFTVINSPPTMTPENPQIVERACSEVVGSGVLGAPCSIPLDCGFGFVGGAFVSGVCGGAPNDIPLTTTPVTTADDDGDAVTLIYEWTVNSVVVAMTTSLDPSLTSAGDIVQAFVTPRDTQPEDGQRGISSVVTIQPTPVPFSEGGGTAPGPVVTSSFASTEDRASTSTASSTNAAGVPSVPSLNATTLAGIPSGPLTSEVLTEYTSSGRVAISINESNVCNVTVNGSLECTGAGSTGLTQPPPGSYSQVAVEVDYACAIRSDDRSIRCWGQPPEELGLLSPPEGAFIQIGLGIESACGLSDLGQIACWGDDLAGRATPPKGQFVYLDVSDSYSCAIAADGIVSCWGLVESDQ